MYIYIHIMYICLSMSWGGARAAYLVLKCDSGSVVGLACSEYGSFRKLGAPNFGVLIVRILLSSR